MGEDKLRPEKEPEGSGEEHCGKSPPRESGVVPAAAIIEAV